MHLNLKVVARASSSYYGTTCKVKFSLNNHKQGQPLCLHDGMSPLVKLNSHITTTHKDNHYVSLRTCTRKCDKIPLSIEGNSKIQNEKQRYKNNTVRASLHAWAKPFYFEGEGNSHVIWSHPTPQKNHVRPKVKKGFTKDGGNSQLFQPLRLESFC